MRPLEFVLVLAVLSAAVWVIAGPLRAARVPGRDDVDSPPEPEPADGLAGLQAAKEAKYREIRDAELDFRTGKLSEADYRALDAELRAEAVEILRALDAAGGHEQGIGQEAS
ncbi:MAG: hypothetical protein M3Z33_05070 [Actinomycetota bacterium]|nr:hypothetical protein [Actinomycetota bacterium]